jgi:hypothetical protein
MNSDNIVRFRYFSSYYNKCVWVVTLQEVVESYYDLHGLMNILHKDFLYGALSRATEKSATIICLVNSDAVRTFGVAYMTDAGPRNEAEYLDIAATEFTLED